MEDIKRFLDLDLPQGQSCFLWGARKTGKSTYLKEYFARSEQRTIYIDLLQADVFQRYLNHPHILREELSHISENRIIILDEVQKVPALLDEVHSLIESHKKSEFCIG